MNDTPHYVINTERALLGAILANNQAYHEVANLLPEHFYLPLHQRTWQAIANRIEAGQIADAVTLQAEFGEKRGAIEITADYFAGLPTCMATFTSVPECAQDIYNCWVRRQEVETRDKTRAAVQANLPREFRDYAPAYLRDELKRLEDAHRDCAARAKLQATRLLQKAAVHLHLADDLHALNVSEHPEPDFDDRCAITIAAVREAAEAFACEGRCDIDALPF